MVIVLTALYSEAMSEVITALAAPAHSTHAGIWKSDWNQTQRRHVKGPRRVVQMLP